jgi:ABC-type nitrate/sulfonate/bicarbonate transport system substrate-binding protein
MKSIPLRIGAVFWVCLLAQPIQAQKLERAVLAFGSTGPNLTPFWVAREAGLYKQYGLDVDVVFFRGSVIAINALATKDAHFGAFGASSSVLARLGGIDTVLIATATPGLLFYLVARKEIRSANDLKGKKIGASRPGTDSDLAARVAVQKLGLSEKDVQILIHGHGSGAVVGDDPRDRRCHRGDHRRLRGGAKAWIPLVD